MYSMWIPCRYVFFNSFFYSGGNRLRYGHGVQKATRGEQGGVGPAVRRGEAAGGSGEVLYQVGQVRSGTVPGGLVKAAGGKIRDR